MTLPAGCGPSNFNEVLSVDAERWDDLPGRLVVISGPSGVGKSTIASRLVEHAGLRARLSVSATTRAARPGEIDGLHYHFMSREAFEAARDRGEFLEWAEVHGALYGTPIGPLRASLAGGSCVLLIIDVQGGQQVARRVPNALLVFINPPGAPDLAALEARLRARGTDDEATIRRRLTNARRELELAARQYPYHVMNDDLDAAVASCVEILTRNGCGGT